uniref:Uncharacterized protein n=1 Tax=Cannabis sativa TaxID=3483 RepID=A0A803NZ55_CANSA
MRDLQELWIWGLQNFTNPSIWHLFGPMGSELAPSVHSRVMRVTMRGSRDKGFLEVVSALVWSVSIIVDRRMAIVA